MIFFLCSMFSTRSLGVALLAFRTCGEMTGMKMKIHTCICQRLQCMCREKVWVFTTNVVETWFHHLKKLCSFPERKFVCFGQPIAVLSIFDVLEDCMIGKSPLPTFCFTFHLCTFEVKLSHFCLTYNSTLPSHLGSQSLWLSFLLLTHSLSAHPCGVRDDDSNHFIVIHNDWVLLVCQIHSSSLAFSCWKLLFLYFPFDDGMRVPISRGDPQIYVDMGTGGPQIYGVPVSIWH